MFEIIALLCIVAAITLLIVLSVIDLKTCLLPNEYVLGLALTGAVFHLATAFEYLNIEDMALGAFIGGGFLYLIRAIANKIYKQDALGLGDVKLLTAGGVWLGPHYILLSLTAGGIAGLFHGALLAGREKRRSGKMPDFKNLSLPAGPGFAIGIFLAGAVMLIKATG